MPRTTRDHDLHSRAVADEMREASAPDIALASAAGGMGEADRTPRGPRVATLGLRRPVEVPVRSPVHTPRFSLRPLALTDKGEFLRVLAASPHVQQFMPLQHPDESPEGCFARHLATARNADASGRCWRRVAVDGLGRIVGGFNLINIERGLAYRADANWWVAGDVLRQGIGTECVYALLDHALGDETAATPGLGLHEVHAHVQIENEASLKLVARVGMRDRGERPQTLQVGEHWLLHRTFVKSVLDRA